MTEQNNIQIDNLISQNDAIELASDILYEVELLKKFDKGKTSTQCVASCARMLHDKGCADNDLFSRSACRSGCSHCCCLFVCVTPGEGELIAKDIKKLPSKMYDRVVSRLKRNAEIEAEGIDEYTRKKAWCAFLDRDTKQCVIYNNRPLSCRNYNSEDVEMCKAAVGNLDGETPRTAMLFYLHQVITAALQIVYRHIGVNYEIQTPLHKSVLSALYPSKGKWS